MACNKCNSSRCGCGDSALHISNFSNNPTECPPNSEPCSEIFSMECISYQGDPIVELDINTGDRLDEVLQKLILGITSAGCATFDDDSTCQSPINLLISSLTSTGFAISWDTVPSALTYVVEYKLPGDGVWTTNTAVTAPTVSDTVIGLTADTIYDVRVQAVCDGDDCYSLNIRIQTATA